MNNAPLWLAAFMNRVASHLHAFDCLSPMGCHYFLEDDIWEVTLFCSATELVGGEQDGKMTYSRFHTDVAGVVIEFTSVEAIEWQNCSIGIDDDLGAHLGIRGRVQNQELWLRILAKPPRDFGCGRIADLVNEEFIERW